MSDQPEQPATAYQVDDETACHLCARLGRLLLSSGLNAARALSVVRDAATAMNAQVHVEIGNDALFVTAGRATRVGRAMASSNVDITRLAKLDATVRGIVADRRRLATLEADLDRDERTGPVWSLPVSVVAVAITAGSLARLFGGSWPVVVGAFAAGLAGTPLRLPLARRGANAIALSFVTALIGGLVAALVLRLFPGQSPIIALAAAGMVLVPGVPLINGVRDLIDGHVGIAVTRLALGTTIVLAITFGLFLAAAIVGDALPIFDAPGRLPVPEDVLFSLVVVVGYVALHNAPRAALPWAALCSVVSHPLRTGLLDLGIDLAAASFVAAIVAGLFAVWGAERYRVPAVTFAFPGTVAMLPGSYGFRAATGGLQIMGLGSSSPPSLVAETLSLAITTMVVTVAIALGLSLAFAFGTALRSATDHRAGARSS